MSLDDTGAVAEIRHTYVAAADAAYVHARPPYRAAGVLMALRALAADPQTAPLLRSAGIARRGELPDGAERRAREFLAQLGDDATLILGQEITS